MTKVNTAKAWVLVRQGRVAEWLGESVLVFGSRKEAQKFAREVIALTPLRGQFTPHPLAGRLLAQVCNRPFALRLDNGDGTHTYPVFSASDSASATADERHGRQPLVRARRQPHRPVGLCGWLPTHPQQSGQKPELDDKLTPPVTTH